MSQETFYDLLSVPPDADQDAIEQAYRAKAKEYHPDVSEHPNARERFRRLKQARAVLTDPEERARYDRMGHEAYVTSEYSGIPGRSDAGSTTDASSGRETDRGSSDATNTTRGETASAGPNDGRSGTNGDRSPEGEASDDGTGGANASGDRSGGDRASEAGSESTDGSRGTRRTSDRTRGTDGTRAGPHGGAATEDGFRGPDDQASRQSSAGEESQRPGRFAAREGAAALTVLGVAGAGAIVAVGVAAPGGLVGTALVVAAWVGVAGVVGTLATGTADWLPDDVVRVQTFPLVLFVAAWYVGTGTDQVLIAAALAGYAAYAMLFRIAALAGERAGSSAAAAAVWFVGTVPAAAVLYETRLVSGGTGGPVVTLVGLVVDVVAAISGVNPSVAVAGLVLAALVPIAIGIGHALWRLGRVLA